MSKVEVSFQIDEQAFRTAVRRIAELVECSDQFCDEESEEELAPLLAAFDEAHAFAVEEEESSEVSTR